MGKKAAVFPEISSLSVIEECIDWVDCRIQQISTGPKESVAKAGYEAEWDRLRKKRIILLGIYKRLETDEYHPAKKDREKLYDIIAHTLQSSLRVHIEPVGMARWQVTLLAVPGDDQQHGIRIDVDGEGWHKRIIGHSFF